MQLAAEVLPGVPRHTQKLSKRDIFILLRKHNPLVLEIGCNDGQDSQEFLNQFAQCELYCFECDPRPIAKFKERIKNPRCKLHETALADQNGVMTLHMSGGTTKGADRADWDMSSSLFKPKEHLKIHPWCTFDRVQNVPTKRLDDWAAENIPDRTVDFVWIDVQGAERLVFAGGQKTLLENTRFVYAEFATREEYEGCWLVDDLVNAFQGFKPIGIYEGYNLLLAKQE